MLIPSAFRRLPTIRFSGRRSDAPGSDPAVRRAGQGKKAPHWTGALIGACAGCLCLALVGLGAFRLVELKVLDVGQQLTFALTSPTAPPDDIVLVAIDERSVGRGHAQYNQWPWPWRIHASLVDRLAKAGASVIAFDILFTERPPDAGGEQVFSQAIAQAGNVILPVARVYPVPAGMNQLAPLPLLQRGAAGLGNVNLPVDVDGIVRRAFLGDWDGEDLRDGWDARGRDVPSLAAAAVGRFLAGNGVEQNVPQTNAFFLRYRPASPSRTPQVTADGFVRQVSAVDVLEGRVSDEILRGRIALVGVTAAGLVGGDRYMTPFAQMGPIPGAYIHAAAIQALLSRDFIRPMAAWQTVGLILFVGATAGLLLYRRSFLGGLAWAVVGYAVLAAVWGFLLIDQGLWVPYAGLAAAFVFAHAGSLGVSYTQEARLRQATRRTFARYVSPAIVEEILAHSDQIRLGGEKRMITTLFADIRGFTSFAESLPAEQVVAELNRYLGALAEVVLRWGGTLDKFTGDGFMAFFGAPIAQLDHAERGVRAAIEMMKVAESLGGILQVGIGISTGEAVVGNVGSFLRMEYTAIGDSVNLASRLQEKADGGQILAVQATVEATSGCFSWETLPPLILKGKRAPVPVWTLNFAAPGTNGI